MSSKQLGSILNRVPSATARGEEQVEQKKLDSNKEWPLPKATLEGKTDRIVAVIPRVLKNEIKEYLNDHRGMTERTVILMALKQLGFKVKDEWIIDKRTTRLMRS